ncbi:hypothetical protein SORBI_3005G063600 [Sorghum bicolor]|uniref:Protein kinase domain-containing protein n=1 Tax=Sorghum bicolor TaxID=4558 RepID=A0A1Z5RI46_SORBI|nr:hypothetical protein SORBI_3005G063600 [Sorghum bicolor]OQU83027.1 hypothetical protein SORBI_3005G063600 [Sorghum bicolor]
MDCEATSVHNLLERMIVDESIEPTGLPLALLKAITNNFSANQQIGKGGFAVVYKGQLQGGTVAVKRLSPELDMDEKNFNHEISSLIKVKHKNIVRFLGYCSDTQGKVETYQGKTVMADVRQRLLCFEFLPNGSLDRYITDASRGLEWRIRYQIIKGICEGLHYLHQNKIVHLDLKPANILLTYNMVPKIADFGLSRCFDENQSQTIASKVVGSLGYLAPESYSRVITFKLDIYSLGVIIMEILTGNKGYSEIENVLESWSNRIETLNQDIELNQVRVCAQIGVECSDFNPAKRPVMQYIIETLYEMEQTYGFIETDLCTSSTTHPFNDGMRNDAFQGSPCKDDTQCDPVNPQSHGPKYNLKLYMHQTMDGPNHNQVNIADPQQPHMFGYTNVHDYPIYDGFGPSAKIVARAQGLHTETCMDDDDWFHWSSIVFSDKRFGGSSFKTIGNQNKHQGEWAIVGGTGVFTFAEGTISINRIEGDGLSTIYGIQISAFCRTAQTTDTEATNDGPDYSLTLYMHQTVEGPNHNQVNIADPKQPQMFGYTNVHDYPIYDGLGTSAKIVARAQGLHTETNMNDDDWFHWSSIVFSDERFQGSSFKAIGNQNKVEGNWAIVGGTGVFTFARGNISIQRIHGDWCSNIKEIHISAFCCTPQNIPTDTKLSRGNAIGPVTTQSLEYNQNLYMHQTIDGPNHNQVNIADPKQPLLFGYTNVHDYPIYDGLGPSAKIVARAQGLHSETCMDEDDWFHWSSIVFTDKRSHTTPSYVQQTTLQGYEQWATR